MNRNESHRIFKYTLALMDGAQAITMPRGAELLFVANQREALCFWARVDTSAPSIVRSFVVYGTGHPLFDVRQTYVGSALFDGGSLVFHVCELLR